MLFERELTGRESWAQVFCDVDAFAPLVHEALRRHGLPLNVVSGLTPGTNAVFRAGDYVVKLYAPPESGFADGAFGRGEWQAMRAAADAGAPLPRPVARGMMRDRYDFAYMIMDYMTGSELGEVLPGSAPADRRRLGAQLRTLHDVLHAAQVQNCPDCRADIVARTLANPLWSRVNEALAAQLKERARSVALEPACLVHGDMTGENVLLTDSGLVLIDFGDAVVAPPCYELPALVIEGMRADAEALEGFMPGDRGALLEQLMDGLALHAFAGPLIESFARLRGLDSMALCSADALRSELARMLRGE